MNSKDIIVDGCVDDTVGTIKVDIVDGNVDDTPE